MKYQQKQERIEAFLVSFNVEVRIPGAAVWYELTAGQWFIGATRREPVGTVMDDEDFWREYEPAKVL